MVMYTCVYTRLLYYGNGLIQQLLIGIEMSKLQAHELSVKHVTSGAVLTVSKKHYWKFAGEYEVIEGEAGEQPEGAPAPFIYAKAPTIKNKELVEGNMVKADGSEVTPERPEAKPLATPVPPKAEGVVPPPKVGKAK